MVEIISSETRNNLQLFTATIKTRDQLQVAVTEAFAILDSYRSLRRSLTSKERANCQQALDLFAFIALCIPSTNPKREEMLTDLIRAQTAYRNATINHYPDAC